MSAMLPWRNFLESDMKSSMLSWTKTKSREDLGLLAGESTISWKLDGLTVVLTYEGGRLTRAVTRGNGEIGEEITANASTFRNLPSKIPSSAENWTLRGEAVIRYSDFTRSMKRSRRKRRQKA